MTTTPVKLWDRMVPAPRRRAEALDPIDVYLIFRAAFVHDPDVRVFLRDWPGHLLVILECPPRSRRSFPVHAYVRIPEAVLEVGARRRLEREADEAVRRFGNAEACVTKRRYSSRADADGALVDLLEQSLRGERRGKRPTAERRSYRCPHCHGWHLTSKRGKS